MTDKHPRFHRSDYTPAVTHDHDSLELCIFISDSFYRPDWRFNILNIQPTAEIMAEIDYENDQRYLVFVLLLICWRHGVGPQLTNITEIQTVQVCIVGSSVPVRSCVDLSGFLMPGDCQNLVTLFSKHKEGIDLEGYVRGSPSLTELSFKRQKNTHGATEELGKLQGQDCIAGKKICPH